MKKLNKICLRTKIEFCITTLLLMSIVLVSIATSVDRTISNTHDDIYTFICNSNGNYWEATESNIQDAIDDLGSNGGMVWLPDTTINVSSTIILNEGVEIIMEGTTLRATADINVVQVKPNSKLQGGTIDVSYVHENTGFTKAAIYFYGGDAFHTADSTLIRGTTLIGTSHVVADGANSGDGINLFSESDLQCIYFVRFENILIRNFHNGIHINRGTLGDNAINGNIFENIVGHICHYFINISNVGDSNTDGNIFRGFMFQPYSITNECIVVKGQSNYFEGFIFDLGSYTTEIAFNLTSYSTGSRIITNAGNNFIINNDPYGSSMILNHGLDIHDVKAWQLETSRINHNGEGDVHFFQLTDIQRSVSFWSPNGNRGVLTPTDTGFSISTSNGDLNLNPAGYVSMLKEIKGKIYSQPSAPDIADNSFAFWVDTAPGSNPYLVLDVSGTQYYTQMSSSP